MQDSIVGGGNAERSGLVQKVLWWYIVFLIRCLLKGDQLISTSGVIYTTERSYGNTMVKGGQKVVRLNVLSEVYGKSWYLLTKSL